MSCSDVYLTLHSDHPSSLLFFTDFREVVSEDKSLCTDSNRKEKLDIETQGVLSKYHSENVYPASKSVILPGVNNNTKGQEEASGRFGIGLISSPLFFEPRLRKWNSYNGETSIDNARSEDTVFHRISSSYH